MQCNRIKFVPLLLAALLALSSCSMIGDTSVASEQGSAIYESFVTGVQAEPLGDYDDTNLIIPSTPYSNEICPATLTDGKYLINLTLRQMPRQITVNTSHLDYSTKINLYNYLLDNLEAVYDNTQPENNLAYWTTGINLWQCSCWKLEYNSLEDYVAHNCPDFTMTNLSYTEGYSYWNGAGGMAAEEYVESYIKPLEGLSDYDKMIRIIDIVHDQCEYDYDSYYKTKNTGDSKYLKQASTIESFLMENKGCCWAYSRAFQWLCLEAGLQCYEIIGDASSGGSSGCHAWNAIVIGQQTYIVDCCWSDNQRSLDSFVAVNSLPGHYAYTQYSGEIQWASYY